MPLKIVGRPYHDDYFQLLQRLAAGKDVTFVTAASDEQVLAAYQGAAVAVLPSVNRTVYGDTTALPEILGFTLMEAMACGAAAICTRVGALSEVVVDGESGFIVPPSDPAALARAAAAACSTTRSSPRAWAGRRAAAWRSASPGRRSPGAAWRPTRDERADSGNSGGSSSWAAAATRGW